MIKTLIFVILGCIAIALLGALGEVMMRYGKRQGIVKENYEEVYGMDSGKIHVIIKPAGSDAYFADVENTLESLQGIVGGYIETVTLAEGMAIICNEEGFINGSRFNTSLCGTQLFGTVMICGVRGEEFSDLPVSDGVARRIFCSLFGGEVTGNDGNGEA